MSGVVSLVNHLGDNKIKFQVIHDSIEGKITTKNDETKFTMVTEAENISAIDFIAGERKKIGLLLWIDVDDYANWYNATG